MSGVRTLLVWKLLGSLSDLDLFAWAWGPISLPGCARKVRERVRDVRERVRVDRERVR